MATLPSGVGPSVPQIPLQKVQDPGLLAKGKEGPSTFDQRLAQTAQPKPEATRVESVRRTEPVAPVTPKGNATALSLTLQKMIVDLEKGQIALDRLINGSLRGKAFSQTDLLALQASMYKYSQELDLTGKVVEKATNGLKDTLKTQV